MSNDTLVAIREAFADTLSFIDPGDSSHALSIYVEGRNSLALLDAYIARRGHTVIYPLHPLSDTGLSDLQAELDAARQEAKELGEMVDNYGETVLELNDIEVKLRIELDTVKGERDRLAIQYDAVLCHAYRQDAGRICDGNSSINYRDQLERSKAFVTGIARQALPAQPSVMDEVERENARAAKSVP